jgi:hypothetical protein
MEVTSKLVVFCHMTPCISTDVSADPLASSIYLDRELKLPYVLQKNINTLQSKLLL